MTTRAVPASLAEVLAFRHPGVIRRYCKEHGVSPTEAEEIFQEMLKWLYLGSRCTADPQATAECVMTEEIEKIDWMWHTFLLFTHDYAAFCDRYFGFFLHHVPVDEAAEPASLDPEALKGLPTRGRRHYVRGARHPVSEDFFHHQPFYLTFPERRFP